MSTGMVLVWRSGVGGGGEGGGLLMTSKKVPEAHLVSDNGQGGGKAAAAKLIHLLFQANQPAVQAQHGHASCHGM